MAMWYDAGYLHRLVRAKESWIMHDNPVKPDPQCEEINETHQT